MTDCGPSDPSTLLAERLAGYLDCHAQSIAQTGFGGFNGGWLGPTLVGGFLTIYVALIGYRLILGIPFGARDAVLATARAGVVMALATSWPAFESTAYRLVFDGPAEVAALVLPSDLAASNLEDTAQRLDKDLLALRSSASEVPTAVTAVNGVTTIQSTPAQPSPGVQPAGEPAQEDPLLRGSAVVLANVTIGAVGAIRVAGGLLLACGPLFILLALFDPTLGLFEGWTRGLVTAFVASIGATVVTALELGFIETELVPAGSVLSEPGLATEPALFAVATLFATAMLAVIVGAFMVGNSFRLFRGRRPIWEPAPASLLSVHRAGPAWGAPQPASRAEVVVDAVRRLTQRETTQSIRSTTESFAQTRERLLQRRSADVQPRETGAALAVWVACASIPRACTGRVFAPEFGPDRRLR